MNIKCIGDVLLAAALLMPPFSFAVDNTDVKADTASDNAATSTYAGGLSTKTKESITSTNVSRSKSKAFIPDTDTLVVADTVLMTADWLQTRGIALNCNSGGGFTETNPIMGRCPTIHGVNQYFLITSGLLIGLNWLLPTKYRDSYLLGIGVVEAGVVGINLHKKVKMDF